MSKQQSRETASQYTGQAANLIGSNPVRLGRFEFYPVWRETPKASGVTIHVFGPRSGAREEVLRFDCFDLPAHYHLGWSYLDRPFIVIHALDPLEWALDELGTNMGALLLAADADPIEERETIELKSALRELSKRINSLVDAHA